MHRIGIAVLLAGALFGQTFEVASVKPASRGPLDIRIFPDRLHITNQPLSIIIMRAYNVERYQITGGPAWLNVDRFDVEAKAEGEVTERQMMLLLQALLADRFRLQAHRETREGSVYALTVAKGGHKLNPPTGDRSSIGINLLDAIQSDVRVHYTLHGKKDSLAQIAAELSRQLRAPVIDRTDIAGEFDFQVTYAATDDPADGIPLPEALREQVGLKLETAKGPVDTLVIDHAEKPSAN